jgi:hypothetical protein
MKSLLAIPGQSWKFNLINSLPAFRSRTLWPGAAPESVDAAIPCLYKDANGGGRNPAAAFL